MTHFTAVPQSRRVGQAVQRVTWFSLSLCSAATVILTLYKTKKQKKKQFFDVTKNRKPKPRRTTDEQVKVHPRFTPWDLLFCHLYCLFVDGVTVMKVEKVVDLFLRGEAGGRGHSDEPWLCCYISAETGEECCSATCCSGLTFSLD